MGEGRDGERERKKKDKWRRIGKGAKEDGREKGEKVEKGEERENQHKGKREGERERVRNCQLSYRTNK